MKARALDRRGKKSPGKAWRKKVLPAQQTRPSRQEGLKVSSFEVLEASSSEEDPLGVKMAPERSYEERSDESKRQPMASCGSGKDLSVKELLVLSTSESSSSDDELPLLGVTRAVNLESLSHKREREHKSSSLQAGERKKSFKRSKGSEQRLRDEVRLKPSAAKVAHKTPLASGVDQEGSPVAMEEGKRKRRYILFVGNIPFAATKEDVVGHFEQRGVPVRDVRLATSKETGKSRGFCFVEFGSPKVLQNALRLHHTRMACGGEGGKCINVEVTCGGGGKGDVRRKKIREKNTRVLRQKRARRGKGKTRDKELRII